MCDKCFNNGIYSFRSSAEWEHIDEVLQNKCSKNFLEEFHEKQVWTQEVIGMNAAYRCKSCGEVWVFSAPENAWRGYLLNLKDAINLATETRRKDRNSQLVLGALILLVIAAFIWYRLK